MISGEVDTSPPLLKTLPLFRVKGLGVRVMGGVSVKVLLYDNIHHRFMQGWIYRGGGVRTPVGLGQQGCKGVQKKKKFRNMA